MRRKSAQELPYNFQLVEERIGPIKLALKKHDTIWLDALRAPVGHVYSVMLEELSLDHEVYRPQDFIDDLNEYSREALPDKHQTLNHDIKCNQIDGLFRLLEDSNVSPEAYRNIMTAARGYYRKQDCECKFINDDGNIMPARQYWDKLESKQQAVLDTLSAHLFKLNS